MWKMVPEMLVCKVHSKVTSVIALADFCTFSFAGISHKQQLQECKATEDCI